MQNVIKRWLARLCWLLCSGPVWATPVLSVDLVASSPKIHQGEVVYVSAQLSGLQTAGLAAVVGAFSLELSFDPAGLQPFNVGPLVGFGTDLGDPSLGEAVTFADFSTPGLMRIAETSLLDEFALANLQSDRLVLATFGFMLTPGATNPFEVIRVSDFSVADAFAQPITDDAGNLVPVQTGAVTLTVPLPPTLALAGLALLAAVAASSRRTCPDGRGQPIPVTT